MPGRSSQGLGGPLGHCRCSERAGLVDPVQRGKARATMATRTASIDAGLLWTSWKNRAARSMRRRLYPERYDAQPEVTTNNGNPWFSEASPAFRATHRHRSGVRGRLQRVPDHSLSPPLRARVHTREPDPQTSPWPRTARCGSPTSSRTRCGWTSVGTFTTTVCRRSIPGCREDRRARSALLPTGPCGWPSSGSSRTLGRMPSSGSSRPAPTPTATVYKLGAGHAPYGVAPDAMGNVWFSLTTDSSSGLIGRLAGVIGGRRRPRRRPPIRRRPHCLRALFP